MPTIVWKKDNRRLPSNAKYVFSAHNKRLTIKNLNTADSGKYRCTFTRALSTNYPEATLTVLGKNVKSLFVTTAVVSFGCSLAKISENHVRNSIFMHISSSNFF